MSLIDRLKSRMSKPKENGCIEWLGAKGSNNYGHINHNKKKHLTHRIAYELFVGKIKEGFVICHSCDNPICLNPDHLFQATQKQNNNDMISKKRIQNGAKHWASKLNEEEVREIRYCAKNGANQFELAKKYNVGQSVISRIKNNNAWTYLD